MITGEQEYLQFLKNVQDGYNPPDIRIRLPQDEPIYEVDLNTRKINAPTFLGVEADHSAEIIFFSIDRYYDSMDLAQMVGMIQFRDAKNKEYYYVIPYYDTTSVSGKIIFPWNIQSPVTKWSGTIRFSIKFFKIAPTSSVEAPELFYEINTLTASSKVLTGWAHIHGAQHDYNAIDATLLTSDTNYVQLMQQYIDAQNAGIYWIDV